MTDVIVIGAGVSALSACKQLLEAGIKDIIVLEANDRIGGRMNTIPFENNFIELGCQWIHGQKGNPVFELAENLGQVDETNDPDDLVYYSTQDGNELDGDAIKKFYTNFETIFDSDEISKEVDRNPNISLGEAFDKIFDNQFDQLVSDSDFKPELIKAIYNSRYNLERLESSCSDLETLSAAGWANNENFEGNSFTKLKNGYSKIIEHLRSQLPKDAIKFNQIVEKIEYDSERGVRVTAFNSKENKRTEYEARKCLSTLPLGIYKEKHQNLFSPPLPNEKIRAIENLGFGVLNKFFFVFDQALGKDVNGLQIYWQENINFTLEASKKWNLKDNQFYKKFENFEALPHCPNVLESLVAGEEGIFTETLSDECLIDVVSELFAKCFPKLHLPRPKKIIRSKWSSDKFTKGSYTYMTIKTTTEDVENLREPLENQVFFAGECTTYKYMGTVHGAFISGGEAADKIIKSLKKGESSRPSSKLSNRPDSSRSNRPNSSRSMKFTD